MNIRLYNALILTMEKHRPVFEGEVWIKNEKIAYVMTKEEADQNWRQEMPRLHWDIQLDCEKNLLMPGFKDAHTHSPMTFLRSFADDLPLEKWLHEKIFPMEAKLTEEDIYELTRLAVLEYLTSGITAVFDMYVKPSVVAAACQDTGMRCVLVPGLNDFVLSPDQVEEEYIKWNKKNSLISYQLGFHAEYTCSKELLCRVSEMAHRYHAPVYTHLSETVKEVEACKARYGMTPPVFLDSLGMFEFGGGGYHCVHMTSQDMDIFRMRRLHVITNPASNLKLASGIAPIAEFEKRKIPVAIGTDGPASNNCLDMFKEMFLVAGLSKVREQDASSLTAQKVLRMATVHGARAMRLSKSDVIARGKYADLILIDLHRPNMQPQKNLIGNLVYSAGRSNVKMTMINGKILYLNGAFNIGENPEYLYKKCNEILCRMLSE